MNLFHLSLPCHSVKTTADFYLKKLGATKGRSKEKWVDINLYNNQITFTQSGTFNFNSKFYRFEKVLLPSFHFGVILDSEKWDQLLEKLDSSGLIVIAATSFLKHRDGEHRSFFVKDPNDYYVEFKTFRNLEQIF